jgi:hypothetical protein
VLPRHIVGREAALPRLKLALVLGKRRLSSLLVRLCDGTEAMSASRIRRSLWNTARCDSPAAAAQRPSTWPRGAWRSQSGCALSSRRAW